jgi:trimeric autotransporter adhesin
VGGATTTLVGDFIRINDQCTGTFNESSTGDIELGGTNGDEDCDTPTSGDNTASARSGFYELNRMVEQAQSHLPANAWLQGQLTANMNINNSCNAFWGGSSVNFYRHGGNCRNTGQIASVFDHEWGHGLDDNDTQGGVISTSNGGGEGIADIYGSLRLNTSCVGRGFLVTGLCNGYGDPCSMASGCSGVRDIDWANHNSGLPHTLTWSQMPAHCGAGSGETHCNGNTYSEAVWDMYTRDFPALYGMDTNTSLETTTFITYIAANVVTGWYSHAGTPHNNCSATFSYNQLLIADDDNGNLTDGTPHMTGIANAYDRLEIDCSVANGGPTVQDSGCAGLPTVAPVLTASGTDMGASLSWTSVGGASSYNVYRTDGIFGCDFGKTLATNTAGLGFVDSGLKNGHPYSYTVIPLGSGGPTCFGPASNCGTIGSDSIFADGFESGDISAWDAAAQ